MHNNVSVVHTADFAATVQDNDSYVCVLCLLHTQQFTAYTYSYTKKTPYIRNSILQSSLLFRLMYNLLL